MKKLSRKSHEFLLRCITDVAFLTLIASFFTIDLWPYKSMLAFVIAGMWVLLFIDANLEKYIEEDE